MHTIHDFNASYKGVAAAIPAYPYFLEQGIGERIDSIPWLDFMHELGLSCVRLQPNSKRSKGRTWEASRNRSEWAHWYASGDNIAVRCTRADDYYILDIDSKKGHGPECDTCQEIVALAGMAPKGVTRNSGLHIPIRWPTGLVVRERYRDHIDKINSAGERMGGQGALFVSWPSKIDGLAYMAIGLIAAADRLVSLSQHVLEKPKPKRLACTATRPVRSTHDPYARRSFGRERDPVDQPEEGGRHPVWVSRVGALVHQCADEHELRERAYTVCGYDALDRQHRREIDSLIKTAVTKWLPKSIQHSRLPRFRRRAQ